MDNIKKIIILGIITVSSILTSYIWPLHQSNPPKSTIDFLDVGQGDAILVRQGRVEMLIDGGSDRSVLSELGRAMPFTDRKLEWVVATHPHDDHTVGLIDLFGRYGIGELILPEALADDSGYRNLLEAAGRHSVPVRAVSAGDRFLMGNAALTVLWPEADCLERLAAMDFNDGEHDPANVCSLVMRYDHCDESGCRRALLMADATGFSEDLLLTGGLIPTADLLKIGHHGSRFATTADFLKAVRPKDAVIPVGEKNTFGHPNYGVILRLRAAGARIWRTDQDGSVRVTPASGGFAVGKR